MIFIDFVKWHREFCEILDAQGQDEDACDNLCAIIDEQVRESKRCKFLPSVSPSEEPE